MLPILYGLLIGFAVTLVANFATTVYLHRTLSHKAMTMRSGPALVFRFVIWVSTGIRPRQWAAVHRKHHAHTDEAEDPHSPLRLGWKRVQLTNVALYRRVAKDPLQVRRWARDLPATRLDRVLLDHALLGLGLGTAALVAIFGPLVGLVAAGFHVVLYLGLSGSVNALAHTFGRRPFETSATNLQWLAFLTAGEGLHNNHHAAPTSARFSLGPREFDPSWWAIRLMGRFGWVTIRHAEAPISVPRSSMAA